MTPGQQRALQAATTCPIRFDTLTRQLYATDASIYQIEPLGVAFPRTPEEAASVIGGAAEIDVPIIPRGAGTGLAGAAIGAGLVVDFSRHNRDISKFDTDSRTIHVQPGVVLDQLNAWLRPHNLAFGPDVATSSRATLGGMIGNNSSGSHAPLYGTTLDHVVSLDLSFADGTTKTIDATEAKSELAQAIHGILDPLTAEIETRMPPGLVKRWPGYGIERWLRNGHALTHILGGSEGTLAAVLSAKLRLVDIPASKSLGVLYFDSVTEAMAATVDILDLKPAAIEHIDRVLFDQTRGQLAFSVARSLLDLDARPCESILLVEFFDDDGSRLETLLSRKLGVRRDAFSKTADMDHIWSLRKAGLSLLTGCKGAAKPTAGIEDVAVSPERLPEYVAALQAAMMPLGLSGSFYGHAASGLLHVRPVVDLHKAEDIAKFRAIADEVSAITKQFKGALAAEHGVGIARTEYLAGHLGPGLMEAHRKIKTLFDPKGLMNPGKIVTDGRFRIDTHLRQGEGSTIEPSFQPFLAFAEKDESFIGNLEQCNGSGACRKASATMCPTYLATGEEIMSTRGRANVIRATLEGRLPGRDSLDDKDLEEALGNCIGCKACKTECPSNVDMALLKSELLHARHRKNGVPIRTRLLSRVDRLGRWGSVAPGLANALMNSRPGRLLRNGFPGLDARRPLPAFARHAFSPGLTPGAPQAEQGTVRLWLDCFARYYEPDIAVSALRVLEVLGYNVEIAADRVCCGRPAFSNGTLDEARQQAGVAAEMLAADDPIPIVVLEPSCYSMLAGDWREMRIPQADEIAHRTILFEEFVNSALSDRTDALGTPASEDVVVHNHCHAKALTHANATTERMLRRLTTGKVTVLNSGCCGMAGAFGALTEKYDLSVKIAEPLVAMLDDAPADATIIASGTSCRHQIEHLTPKRPVHSAQWIAQKILGDRSDS